jgi:hypothetical protein
MRTLEMMEIDKISGGMIGGGHGPGGIPLLNIDGGGFGSCTLADARSSDPFLATSLSGGGSWGGGDTSSAGNGFWSMNQAGTAAGLAGC